MHSTKRTLADADDDPRSDVQKFTDACKAHADKQETIILRGKDFSLVRAYLQALTGDNLTQAVSKYLQLSAEDEAESIGKQRQRNLAYHLKVEREIEKRRGQIKFLGWQINNGQLQQTIHCQEEKKDPAARRQLFVQEKISRKKERRQTKNLAAEKEEDVETYKGIDFHAQRILPLQTTGVVLISQSTFKDIKYLSGINYSTSFKSAIFRNWQPSSGLKFQL